MLDPNNGAAKWNRNLKGATQSITDGVNAVTTAPTAKAAAQADKWLSRLNDAKTKDKFKSGLNRVTLQQWQTAMLQKGVQRVAAGADAGQSKYQSFASDFYPYLAQGQAKVAALPKLTLEDSINRMTTMIRHNAGFVRKS